jgi:DedD protein
MKLTMDERIKHRIVGLAVILSVAAIILPALLKKSNQSFDAMTRVAVRLPARPQTPQVSVADETRLFKTMKVAEVKIPVVSHPAKAAESVAVTSLQPTVSQPTAQLAEASTKVEIPVQSAPEPTVLPTLPKVNVTRPLSAPPMASKEKVREVHAKAPHSLPLAKPPAKVRLLTSLSHARQASSPSFSVQVASFSSEHNARILINKLQTKGYQAHVAPVSVSKGGVSYKVLVGRGLNREKMVQLQRQLYSQMQLRGFVVPSSVG